MPLFLSQVETVYKTNIVDTTMTKMGATLGFAFALVLLFVNFDIISSKPSVSMGNETSTKYGFAAITTTEIRDRTKIRVCEEWKKQEIINSWKCIKFIDTPTK